jgi:hypothetical protein
VHVNDEMQDNIQDVFTYTQELSTSHVDNLSHIWTLVPHMGAIIVSLKKEVAKKNNCNFKHITLT